MKTIQRKLKKFTTFDHRFAQNYVRLFPKTGQKRSSKSPEDDPRYRNEFSLRNGAMLLEELIRVSDGKYCPLRIFSIEELKKASNNYDEDRVLFLDTNYKLHLGIHEDKPFFIKNMIEDEDDNHFLDYCIREIAIASHVNGHGNLIKILGCCLETKVPILVFEYLPNGPLSGFVSGCKMLLPWKIRIRIAVQIADAIAYLHVAKSQPILHRHIKSDNIFLDESFNAKLFDFGLSLVVPVGETHVEAEVEGTIGFIAPESCLTGKFTEKSDVFAFGSVLLEILTGKEACHIFKEAYVSGCNTKEAQNITEVGEDDDIWHPLPSRRVLLRFLKANMVKEGKLEELLGCAELASRCVEELSEKRPSMKEVAQKLRQIRNN